MGTLNVIIRMITRNKFFKKNKKNDRYKNVLFFGVDGKFRVSHDYCVAHSLCVYGMLRYLLSDRSRYAYFISASAVYSI